jgi:hypothetical protein
MSPQYLEAIVQARLETNLSTIFADEWSLTARLDYHDSLMRVIYAVMTVPGTYFIFGIDEVPGHVSIRSEMPELIEIDTETHRERLTAKQKELEKKRRREELRERWKGRVSRHRHLLGREHREIARVPHMILDEVADAICDHFPMEEEDIAGFDEFETDAELADDPEMVELLREYHDFLENELNETPDLLVGDESAFIGLSQVEQDKIFAKHRTMAVKEIERKDRQALRRERRAARRETRRDMTKEGRTARREARKAAGRAGKEREKERVGELKRRQEEERRLYTGSGYYGEEEELIEENPFTRRKREAEMAKVERSRKTQEIQKKLEARKKQFNEDFRRAGSKAAKDRLTAAYRADKRELNRQLMSIGAEMDELIGENPFTRRKIQKLQAEWDAKRRDYDRRMEAKETRAAKLDLIKQLQAERQQFVEKMRALGGTLVNAEVVDEEPHYGSTSYYDDISQIEEDIGQEYLCY